MDTTKTESKKFSCVECKNQVDLSPKELVNGDISECPFCGIEYEVVEKTLEGEYVLQVIEEEK